MTVKQGNKLLVGDRVLFDYGRHGYVEGFIREIAPSGKFVYLAFTIFGDSVDWVPVGRMQERLAPLPPRKRWFS